MFGRNYWGKLFAGVGGGGSLKVYSGRELFRGGTLFRGMVMGELFGDNYLGRLFGESFRGEFFREIAELLHPLMGKSDSFPPQN